MRHTPRPYFYQIKTLAPNLNLPLSLNEFRDFLRLDDMAPETLLQESLRAGAELLELKTGLVALTQEYEIITILYGERKFTPARSPITEILAVEIDGAALDLNVIRHSAKEILFPAAQFGELKLRFRAGAATPQTLPAYVKRILLQIAGLFYDTRSHALSETIITEAERLLALYHELRI